MCCTGLNLSLCHALHPVGGQQELGHRPHLHFRFACRERERNKLDKRHPEHLLRHCVLHHGELLVARTAGVGLFAGFVDASDLGVLGRRCGNVVLRFALAVVGGGPPGKRHVPLRELYQLLLGCMYGCGRWPRKSECIFLTKVLDQWQGRV